MRAPAKRLIELSLCRLGVARLARLGRGADTIVLAYHNIVPHGEPVRGDGSLHLRQAEFAKHLDLVGRTHDVVSVSALLEPYASSGRPRAVITFDDACQGAVTAGVEELARRGLPATIFVAPAYTGGGSFWWDTVVDPSTGFLEAGVRRHALEALAGRDDEVRRWATANGMPLRAVPPHQTCATLEQLEAADAAGGVTFASHTWSHPNLTRLTSDLLQEELERPLAWLSERLRHVVPWVSYPYGLVSRRVAAAAAAAGYRGAFRVDGGWIRGDGRREDAFTLPRQNIPAGLSLKGFEARVSGLLSR